jgi:hypothetical protein
MHKRLTAAPAVWHRYPPLAQFEPLEPRQRQLYAARASVRVPLCRRYTVVDVAQVGAAYYAPQRPTRQPHWTPVQAAMLDAIRMLRRWDYVSVEPAPAAAPNQPLDGCHCRACILRA